MRYTKKKMLHHGKKSLHHVLNRYTKETSDKLPIIQHARHISTRNTVSTAHNDTSRSKHLALKE